MERKDRIEKLREMALGCYTGPEEFLLYFMMQWEQDTDRDRYDRYARAYSYAFSKITPAVVEGELLVGRTSSLQGENRELWENRYRDLAHALHDECGQGQDSHMAIDYERLLTGGISGIHSHIQKLREQFPERADYYSCCLRCLEAVCEYADRYAGACLKTAETTKDPGCREELYRLAEILKKVPQGKPETFYEAVQSAQFVTHCLSFHPLRSRTDVQQFQLGRPDRYLRPYYERDLAAGILTKEEAQDILDCLGILINMRMPNGFASGYIVGGRDENGQVVCNELTLMLLRVIENVRLIYPAAGFCWTKDTPDEYLREACRILLQGRSHPAVFNDDLIASGLRHYGIPEKDSHDYIHSNCVEITPIGASNVWVASPYSNMLQMLLDCMDREYDSFDDLVAEVLRVLDRKIGENYRKEEADRHQRREKCIHPFLSCFVKDCMEEGLDIEQGGARYNWIMPSFVGMANLVDSLFALKTVVFEQKRFTMAQIKEICDRNFAGDEELRRELLTQIPKYGNDIDAVDAYYQLFVDHIVAECEKYESDMKNGRLIPSVFCWIMHERLGTVTGASPDGRYAGFPLGDGSGPCQGRESCGPTASILSSTKWSHEKMIGGVAVNMKFSRKALGPDSLATLENMIKVYLLRGGFEIQINIVDRETLLKAQKDPESYRDLVVRIGGYSDYFVRLSENMQNEIIMRTEHEL